MCRSPRMSSSSISSGSVALAGRLELAAVLAQLRRDVLHAEPLVDLLLGGAGVRTSPVSSSAMPYSLTCRPRLTASVRSASLWLARAGEVLEQVAERLLRARSAGRPAGRCGSPPWRPPRRRCCTVVDQRRARRSASTSAAGSLDGGDDVEVLARVGQPPRAARQLDADRRPGARAAPRPAPRRPRAPSRAACAALGGRRRRRRAPRSTFSSALAPKPGTSFSRPCSAAAAQLVERRDAELVVEQLARRFGPRPGDAGDLDQARRDARLQLVGGGDRAGLEQRVDLLRDRLARRPASSVDAALLAPAPRPTRRASRIALAALR